MASIFTFDPDPPRVASPWSTSEMSTSLLAPTASRRLAVRTRSSATLDRSDHDSLADYGISKLDPEPQEGPTEYKLHLLLRPRRLYVSMSTGHVVGGSYHSRASLSPSDSATPSATPSSYETSLRLPQTRSTQSRQQRLQQLTTQLLWRLQQSSPFHSSTTANNLVLPVLPDSTPQSDATQKPARLLPGLEESQGALYEIGVADDGTFVGLTEDELEESLSNLQVMASSLGCKVDVLRKVIVGNCEWEDDPGTDSVYTAEPHTDNLWVAEALVTPDLDFYRAVPTVGDSDKETVSANGKEPVSEDDHSSTEQIRISITGPITAGKSSLLGTLTSSSLDNGRGKSRLGLLKHRHEISSGITSSVAQELIGYAANDSPASPVDVVNYASGNVAAWDDIHVASTGGRLAFVSDLPGAIRYSKSMLRGLVSWAPHYVILCIPANCDDKSTSDNGAAEQTEINMALSYLVLCIKLQVPILIAITKMDLASRAGLRNTLARILSALKQNNKKPAMLPVSSGSVEGNVGLQQVGTTDGGEVRKVIATMKSDALATVPIILTSAVDGSGLQKLHAFFRHLPIPERPPLRQVSLSNDTPSHDIASMFDIDEVFAIPPSKVYTVSPDHSSQRNHGVVLCGLVRYGSISIGDELVVGPLLANPLWQRARVVSVRNVRLPVRKLTQDQVGTVGIEPVLAQEDETPSYLGRTRKGTVLASPPASTSITKPMSLHTGFVARFPFAEFSSSESPPLLLGGNAIVYIANIRTAVRVTTVELADNGIISSPPSPTEPEFFSFDGDGPDRERPAGSNAEVKRVIDSARATGQENIHITFSFVTSLEWVEVGSRVLIMPGMMGSSSSMLGLSGLEGFVGTVKDVVHER